MPWKESRIVDQRLQFLSSYQKEEMSLSDLCREFGVSRPTGYRWINRYKEVGPEGLLDLSRKPHGCSHATSETTENAILALRSKHPSWGARKLKARLEKLQPDVSWPAASTFGNILNRAGLTRGMLCCPKLLESGGNRKQNVQISCIRKAEQSFFHYEPSLRGLHQVTYGWEVFSVADRHVTRVAAAIRSLIADVKSGRHLQILQRSSGRIGGNRKSRKSFR